MANVLRFVTKEKRSKLKKKISISSGCEIIIFPGIRYNRSENIEVHDENITKRRVNTVKIPTEPKRKRGT